MKLKDYAKFVEKRAKMGVPLDKKDYSFIGLAEESGEVLGCFKKGLDSMYRPDAKDTDAQMKDEVGDVLHYVQRICLIKGWTIKDCLDANVEKLNKRYGLGG